FTGYDTAPGEPAAHQIQQAEHIIHEAATIIEMATLYYRQKGLLKLHRRTQELAQQLVLRATPEAVFEAIAGAVKELLAADLVWMQYVTTDGRVQFFQSEEFFEVPPLSFPGSPCRIASRPTRSWRCTGAWTSGTGSWRRRAFPPWSPIPCILRTAKR